MSSDWKNKRIICDLDTGRPGPLLLCTAGIHGNEPAGGEALLRILQDCTVDSLKGGRLLALTGNMKALATGDRYLHHDLNRIWTPERAERLLTDKNAAVTPEEEEMAELLPLIHEAMEHARGDFYLLDLHSTSGPGAPFACCMDVTHHREFMESFKIPMILGLRPRMQGTLMDYIAFFSYGAVGVEGGQNEDPDTIDCHEASIRVAMSGIGMIDGDKDPRVEASRQHLMQQSRGLPHYLEIKHRYAVEDDDTFEMLPGFENFSAVKEGQVVARDISGEIKAKEDGIMLFPRYQPGGEDGFFLAVPTTL